MKLVFLVLTLICIFLFLSFSMAQQEQIPPPSGSPPPLGGDSPPGGGPPPSGSPPPLGGDSPPGGGPPPSGSPPPLGGDSPPGGGPSPSGSPPPLGGDSPPGGGPSPSGSPPPLGGDSPPGGGPPPSGSPPPLGGDSPPGGGSPPSGSPPLGLPPSMDPNMAKDPATSWEFEIAPLLQPFNYDGKGRRDPFHPYQDIEELEEAGNSLEEIGPVLPLARWDIDRIQLIGLIWNAKNPKAIFRTPGNEKFTLGKGERIGRNNGYIRVIREDEVVVVEPVIVKGESNLVTRIMRLKKN